jgi:bifunctional isochorismate lyase/aryl carrier protein
VKQLYFSPSNLQPEAQAILAGLPRIRQDRAGSLEPAQSALLVLDMQKYFFEPSSHAFIPSAPAILPGVQRLIDAFARLERPIVFSQHTNTPQDAGMMAAWWRDLILADDPMSELLEALDTSTGEILRKSQYDAFFNTGLEESLKRRGVTQIVICGVMTHLCCETTARSAFMRGFGVFFTVDGTATYNRDFHTATLMNLSHGVAVPVLVQQVLAALPAELPHG